jgi:hypothetical protein
LVDGPHAELEGPLDASPFHADATEDDVPFVGGLGAGKHPDEGGLAGTVLAQQGTDLTTADGKLTSARAWTPP